MRARTLRIAVSVAVGLFGMLFGGTSYAFAAYSEALRIRDDLEYRNLDLLVSSNDIAVYAGSIAAGWWFDHHGPRALVVAGGAMMLAGYALLGYGDTLVTDWVALVTFGFGSTCAYVSAVAPNVRLFAPAKRGLVVGAFVATYAMSPILFIKVKQLMVGLLGDSYSTLSLFFVVFGACGFGASLLMAAFIWDGDEETRLMNEAAKPKDASASDAAINGEPAAADAEAAKGSEDETTALLNPAADADGGGAAEGSKMNPYVESTGLDLLYRNKAAAVPFWILACSFGMAVCSGLAVINQLGVVSRVLEAKEDAAIAYFSIGSATARLVFGAVCDFVYERGYHRGFALIIESAFLFVVLVAMSSPLATAETLPWLALFSGFGYGGNWSVGTSIVNLTFGSAGFGLNLGFITAAPSAFIIAVNRVFGALVPTAGCAAANGSCLTLSFGWLALVSATSMLLNFIFIFMTSGKRSDIYKKKPKAH